MTRQKWTTKEQETYLEDHKPAFLVANQNKSAAKEFFPTVVKEFRDRWPVPAPTQEEINDAGSLEFAMRVKKNKYDKRTCSWFHNNTRTVTSEPGARGVLKVKAKQPRKLQAWQAYQALTYESRWKKHVNKGWDEYKQTWKKEHPEVPIDKNRFVFMVEFMKAKLAEETDEMKKRCEKYREPEERKAMMPKLVDTQVNSDYQTAIEKLPRTLATIGDSLMKQTGWQITILAGGPSPEAGGTIMTYLSHAGKTKDGQSFKDFLGKKDYDEHMLIPFEKFLNHSFSAEDCALRSLIKDEKKPEDNGQADHGSESETEKDVVNEDDEASSGGSEVGIEAIPESSSRISEYELRKQKNIAELRDILVSMDLLHPMSYFKNLEKAERASAKTDEETGKGKGKAKEQEVDIEEIRSESPPIIDTTSSSSHDTTVHGSSTATSTSISTTPLDTGDVNTSHGETPDKNVSSSAAISTNIELPNHAAEFLSQPVNVASGGNTLSLSFTASIVQDIISSTAANSTASNPNDDGTPSPCNTDRDSATTGPSDTPEDTDRPPISDKRQDREAVNNNDDLPGWLSPMIGYLHDASANNSWQELVAHFVHFERSGPPTGNLPTKSRPPEIANWIKSKKKDVVPSVDIREYGMRFTGWWKNLQPSWRTTGAHALSDMRDVPKNETWQSLRKGGTAGIYVVLMGLSWWILAQSEMPDATAWLIVDDLSWVVQQMTDKSSRGPKQLSAKRSRDREEDDSDTRRRKSRRTSTK